MVPRKIRSRLAAAAATMGGLSLAILSFARPAAAQDAELPRYIEVDPTAAAETGIAPWNVVESVAKVRSQFRLFGEGDRAWTSLRMVGDNRIYETNSGPGDDWGLFTTPIVQFSTATGNWFQSFGIPTMIAAPRSEWVRYLVEGVESMRNVRGDPPGWTVLWNGAVFARPKDINSADGLVGTLLSGVTSTTDGSCFDHSQSLGGALLPAGFQLLPGSNCQPTWSKSGTTWLGDRPIPPDNWIDLFNQQGEDFRWNRWQVPPEMKDSSRFMGNNFSTYGHFNDYNSTTLKKFGNVIPGASGEPSRSGYPLGLDFYFDAFSFTIPTVANAKFWTALVVNNSEELYGFPHDYDSLYWGIGPWPGRRQDGDNYVDVARGAWMSAESSASTSPSCAAVDPIPLLSNTCGGFNGSRPDGFSAGGHGIVVLKSPIGDLRNKLFTQPGPFFLPTHPLAGDTITFNHAVNWNFGNWGSVWNQGTERMRFGVMSSTRDNTLDGVACNDFVGLSTRWRTFQSNEWPDGDQCQYKAWVPPAPGGGFWTYVSGRPEGADPAGPDTLHLPGCGPTDGGACAVPWADSTWQGWSANSFGNLSEFSLGPFRLEAGDTTEIFIAMYSGKDSVSFEAITTGIVDFYLGLFQGPEAPPAVTIQDLDVGAGINLGSIDDAQVTLTWDDAAEDYVDAFMAKFADDMEAAPTGTELAVIRDANPGIVDRIRARAADNLKQLMIFRSCDGGSTFDSNADCEGDPTTDAEGNSIAPGWEAFAVLRPDASGDFPNTFTDGSIIPGVTYLYSLLGQTIGFEEVVITDPNATIDGLGNFTCGPDPCETDTLIVAPSLLNPLSRSAADPNVVSVYIPTSVASGGTSAQANIAFDTRTALGRTIQSMDLERFATTPFNVLLNSGDLQESMFKVRFSNFLQVTEWDDATTEGTDSTRVVIQDLANTVPDLTSTTVTTASLSTQSWKRTDGIPVTLNGANQVSQVTNGDLTKTVYEIGPGSLDPDTRTAIGFVLIDSEGLGLPLLVSGNLTGDAATPGSFIANPGYPGFFVSADNTGARSFDQEFWMDANGDTLSTQLDPSLNYDQANSDLESVQSQTFGEYILKFVGSLFGPGEPFLLDIGNPNFDPADVDAAFDASLEARQGITTVTDAEAEVLVAEATGQDTADFDLVAANVPFEVANLTHGRETIDLAMIDRGEATKTLGLFSDTVSVTVAADKWIPGDALYVIERIDVLQTDTLGLGAIVVDGSGNPQSATVTALSFNPLRLTCGGANPSCNPASPNGAGFGQYTAVAPGDELHVLYFSPFENQSRFQFSPTQAIEGGDIIADDRSIAAQMDSIRVVPNPYLFFSSYEASGAERRLMFTHLPPDGSIRIYSIAGNFVQEIDWGPGDLTGNGDLFYDMMTREGNELGAGLFLFVVTAQDPATGRELKKTGKFVVIR